VTRLLAVGSTCLAAPFLAVPRLGALAAVVVTALVLARRVWRRVRPASGLAVDAERSARRAEVLGFVNEPHRGRRSPDFQYVTRAGPQSTPRVLDDMPGRITR
jgi:hypothetical protein